ncbi:MAG TPA: hypothetical protein VIH57_06775 [Bacteroidales bacterium]
MNRITKIKGQHKQSQAVVIKSLAKIGSFVTNYWKKGKSYVIRFCLLMIPMVALHCDLLKSEKDECDKTKWKAPVERYVTLKLYSIGLFLVDEKKYNLADANTAYISGTFTKKYCNGNMGGSFAFDFTFHPYARQDLTDVRISQYIIKFENDEDNLVLVYRIKFTFNDNKIYETQEQFGKFYFKDLRYNFYENDYFVLLEPTLYPMIEVTK